MAQCLVLNNPGDQPLTLPDLGQATLRSRRRRLHDLACRIDPPGLLVDRKDDLYRGVLDSVDECGPQIVRKGLRRAPA
jgi:hypothetical protein